MKQGKWTSVKWDQYDQFSWMELIQLSRLTDEKTSQFFGEHIYCNKVETPATRWKLRALGNEPF